MLEILENKKVLSLIERIKRAEEAGDDQTTVQKGKTITTRRYFYRPGSSVFAVGYDPSGMMIFLTYADRQEFDEMFMKRDRNQMNGCAVARIHSGAEYMVFIEGMETPGNSGEFIVQGKDKWKNTIDRRFPTREQFLRGKAEVYKRVEGYAVTHQVGTKIYHLVEAEKFKT